MQMKKWALNAVLGFVLVFALTFGSGVQTTVSAVEESVDEVTELTFNDDYTTFTEDFYQLGGEWSVENGLLKQTKSSQGAFNMQINYRKKLYGDFTAKMRFRLVAENGSLGWFGFFFKRAEITDTHEMSGYGILTEGASQNPPGKTYMVNWSKSIAYEYYATQVDVSDFVDLVVVAKGSTYSFYFGDAILTGEADITIDDDAFKEAGFIGIGAGSSRIEVDYLNLYTGNKQSGIVGGGTVEVVSVSKTFVVSAKGVDVIAIVCSAICLVCLAVLIVDLVINKKKGGKINEK